MVGRSTPITAADRKRFEQLQEIGCIVSRLQGNPTWPCEIHHLLSGGRRRGHQFTIGLTPWYHRGVPNEGMTKHQMTQHYGPSLAFGSKAFRYRFGSDDFLLAEVNKFIDSTTPPRSP